MRVDNARRYTISVRLTAEEMERYREYARRRLRPLADLIRSLLDEDIAKHEQQ